MTKTVTILNALSAQAAPLVTQAIGKGFQVRAASRDKAKLIDRFGKLDQLTALEVDFHDATSIETAFEGADGAFGHLPIPMHPDHPAQWLANIIQATKNSRLPHLVFSTSGPTGARYGSTPMIDGCTAVKTALEAATIPVTILMPTIYLENMQMPPFVPHLHSDGILTYPPVPTDMKVSFTSHADQARFALAAFEKPELIGQAIEIASKPHATGQDIANIFARHLSKPVKFTPLSPETFGANMGELFQNEIVGAGLTGLYKSISQLGPEGMLINVAALEQQFGISLPPIADQIGNWPNMTE